MRFADKVFAITGAAQGIGRRVAERAASEGAAVAVIDRSPLGADVANALYASGAKAVYIAADLETYQGAVEAMDGVITAFGRIDVLVNNVGGTIWAKPFAHYEPAQIDAEIRRSLMPTLYCCHAVLPAMLAAGEGPRAGEAAAEGEKEGAHKSAGTDGATSTQAGGKGSANTGRGTGTPVGAKGVIVNVSSIATRSLNRVPYAAAKGGVNAITASLAWELAPHGIRVVATAPGGTQAPPRAIPRNTAEQTPQEARWYQQIVEQTINSSLMQRYGTLDEQAAVILFLASNDASYLTGMTIPVGGGDLG